MNGICVKIYLGTTLVDVRTVHTRQKTKEKEKMNKKEEKRRDGK